MKTYWDTSAAINAAVSPEVNARLNSGEHVTRLHLLGEFFATMTGRGVEIIGQDGLPERMVFSPKDCSAWLRRFAARVQFEELDKQSLLDALDKAQARGVVGPQVYDYWHVLVCAKAKADLVLSRNTDDFSRWNQAIGGQAKLAWP